MLELNKIHNMNCIDGMRKLEDNSVDSIVTDPPYELGFMGKSWDATGIAYSIVMWKECFRILKPGGFLLSFGGTRTYHRMVCAIEDAGFEIRDQIQWIYGSGFPKSMDISKAIDKKYKAKREIVGVSTRHGGGKPFADGASGFNTDKGYITIPTTDQAQQWDGWGTALKPAHEPIVVVRKPLSEKTVADNVLKWGTGGINIDDCRVEYNINESAKDLARSSQGFTSKSEIYHNDEDKYKISSNSGNEQGRFPANVIFDEEAGKILDEQSGNSKSVKGKPRKAEIKNQTRLNNSQEVQVNCEYNDSGGASRFFYCAKASKKERGEGNNHPTVKPIALIKYLITLVTPPQGISCDPFEGSGTHAKACKELGFDYIGFEKEKDYCEIAENRFEIMN